jgi:hypothetical protein
MSKIKEIISLIKVLKKNGVIGSDKKSKDKKKKKHDKDKIKRDLVKKNKHRFLPRQPETPYRSSSDHMHQMIASRGSNPHETPDMIRAQKEINDLRFDNQRKEAKLKEIEDSYKDFSEHTRDAVGYLLEDQSKYKPARFNDIPNAMGPENIEEHQPEINERDDEYYNDYDDGDFEEAFGNTRERYYQAKREERQGKMHIDDRFEYYYDDNDSDSLDPQYDPFTDTLSEIGVDTSQGADVVVPTTAGSTSFVNSSQTQHNTEQETLAKVSSSVDSLVDAITTPKIIDKRRRKHRAKKDDVGDEYQDPSEDIEEQKITDPKEFHDRTTYKLKGLSKETFERSQEKKPQKIRLVKRDEEEEEPGSRYQTRSVTRAKLESEREQSRPQTRSVTQSQHRPIHTTILPVTTGKKNAEILKDYYFNELGAPADVNISKLQGVAELRNLAASHAKKLYQEAGGRNNHILRSGNADEVYDEYLNIKGIKEEDIKHAREKYILAGGKDPNILKSKNIDRIKRETAGLASRIYFRNQSK